MAEVRIPCDKNSPKEIQLNPLQFRFYLVANIVFEILQLRD